MCEYFINTPDCLFLLALLSFLLLRGEEGGGGEGGRWTAGLCEVLFCGGKMLRVFEGNGGRRYICAGNRMVEAGVVCFRSSARI